MKGASADTCVFVGVDLAWAVDQRHTGIAVMEGGPAGVRVTEISAGVHSLAGVTELIGRQLRQAMVVAVDASLIVRNESGQRPCERAIGVAFGRFGACCHSTHRNRRHFDSGERLVQSLARVGFEHGLALMGAPRSPGRWVIEVYPHPAMVRLFALQRIISYKKGTIDERRAGLERLQRHLRGLTALGLQSSDELERVLCARPACRAGRELKQLEDLLDAVFCAYLAWHCWRWGGERNEAFGDLASGYIIVPRPAAGVALSPGEPLADGLYG